MNHTPSSRRWRIGDLAEATGLTVRTLHHYEQLGLLAPRRTDGNQRLYGAEDVARLYRIRALRDLGLSLAEIGPMLDGDGGGLAAVLQAHRARVEEELQRLSGLHQRLLRVCAHASASTDDLLGAVEAMARVERHVARRRASGRAEEGAEARWRALGESLRACMVRAEPPTSPEVLELATRARAYLNAFAERDPATLDALARLRRANAPTGLAGWDDALTRYLDEALNTLEEEDPC